MAQRHLDAAHPLCAHGADPSPSSIISVEEQIIEFKKVAAKIAEASPTSMDGELTLRRSLDDGNDRARERGHAPCGDSKASASIVPITSTTRRRSSWLDPPSPLEGTRPQSTSAASAPFTLDTTSHRSMDNAPAPDAHLPPPFLTPTNVHEREMYAQELIHRLVQNKTTIEISWQPRSSPRSGRPVIELLCVFIDKLGSLSAIASMLASLKINIMGLSAFSTDTGIAIDTFEVDRFDESAGKSLIACMEGLAASRQVLSATVDPREERPLSSHLPSSYITSTTAQERVTHAQLFQRLVQHTSSVELSWHPLHDRPGVVLSCVFVDRRGSLSAITNTLASHGINIAGLSAFSTDTGIAIDTFEVDRFDESAAKSLISCMEGLYFSSNLPTPLMLLSASSPSHSPASSHSGSIRGGDSFVKHMSELSQRSPRPIQTERGSAVAALRFKSLLRNLAIGSSNGSARHTAR